MGRVRKRELVTAISKKTGVTHLKTMSVVNGLLEEIKEHFKQGHLIELRGFGTFYPRFLKAMTYKIERLGEVRARDRTVLKFKSSRQIFIYNKK